MSFYPGNCKYLIPGDDYQKERMLGMAASCRCLDEATRGDAFLNLLLINREVKDVVIISSVRWNSGV